MAVITVDKRTLLLCCVCFASGIFACLLWVQFHSVDLFSTPHPHDPQQPGSSGRESDLSSEQYPVNDTKTLFSNNFERKPYVPRHDDNTQEKPVRLLCWVLTYPDLHATKALAVARTWGQRCDTLLFMSSVPAKQPPNVIALPVNESREGLWEKSKLAWGYVYYHHRDDADWFLKADDDSYVMVHNLRAFVAGYDPNSPHYFGRHFVVNKHEYMSGGAGYLISRGALQLLGQDNKQALSDPGILEDYQFGDAMTKLQVPFGDTRDDQGRETFFPLSINHLRYWYSRKKYPTLWFWTYSKYPPVDGLECCSRRWIATHYAGDARMYEYERQFLSGEEGCGT